MGKIKKLFVHKIFKKFLEIIKWTFFVLLGLYIILVIVRIFHFVNLDKTNAQVKVIHSTKITMDDVMGVNLPPDPGVNADKTVQGIDANHNGIRDDVELAIFEKYPNSAKTRAALLQYALAQQMQVTQPFVNNTIATEVLREDSRADYCLANTLAPRDTPESFRTNDQINKIDKYIFFIKELQFNTEKRKSTKDLFFKKLKSYSDLDKELCDFDYSKLEN